MKIVNNIIFYTVTTTVWSFILLLELIALIPDNPKATSFIFMPITVLGIAINSFLVVLNYNDLKKIL